jgi:membrane protease YdiL (CAAX protease family)
LYVVGAAGTIALLAAHVVCVRWIDKREWQTVGLHRAAAGPRLLAEGFVLGIVPLALAAAALLLVGWLDLESARDGSSMRLAVLTLLALAPAALMEELALRGYVFSVLRESWGWKPALLVLSVLFGAAHWRNPGATLQTLTLVSLAGVFLGMVLVATGSLYAAWLAHLAWNWMLVAILHTEVSGLALPVVDYRMVERGPDWVTGGSWGPEGGIAAGAGMLLGIAYLIARRERRGESRHG